MNMPTGAKLRSYLAGVVYYVHLQFQANIPVISVRLMRKGGNFLRVNDDFEKYGFLWLSLKNDLYG